MPSKDLNIKDAQIKIAEMTSAEEINAFIVGDERKTVLDAAETKIKELKGLKQGEQADAITKDSHDFKEGIQKTKSFVTCEDVIEKMRKEGRKI
ncbi:MAG: hypothetical protein A2Y53_00885 [Chloroflexi bacterium RBG_16_47_49]|nr:MAG: hypothetical protein A2Y53_00885 [Chloroflexi bacterium RBG_16_47_49]